MGYDGALKFDTKIDESGFNSGVGKLGSIAKSGMAVLGTAVAGCVASFGALTKASLDSVASLEQNIGGVQTLFKESADAAIDNAKKAYQTASMSANYYMSTVTSFSASLLQSLGGDTAKAAQYADRAVTDMSDNANKMGTSIDMIVQTYQSLARGNFAMLDNLKLGYGGTKKELERLIADANRVKEANGEMADLSMDSFADVTEAIHIIQTEMGITGTTAKEAATTIEGSMNSAKAAWDNFLNGTATVDELVDAFGIAGEVIAENLGAILPRLVATVPATAKGVATGFINAFHESGIAEAGLQILSDFANGIQECAPTAISAGADVISNFISGIASNLPELVPRAIELVATLAEGIVSNLPKIISAGISLLKGLVQGIINSLPTLIAEGPRLINDFASAIYNGIGELIKTGLELIVALVKGIWDNRGLLLENAGEIFLALINVFSLSNMVSLGENLLTSLGSGIKNMFPSIKSAGEGILTNLINGIKALATHPVTAIKGIITNIKSAFTSFSWSSIGQNIISGIASGLKKYASKIVSAAKSAAASALTAAKNALGIRSPSTVFREQVGKYMAQGLGIGFEENIPVEDMAGSLTKTVQKMQKSVSGITKNVGVQTTNAGSVVHYNNDVEDDSEDGRVIYIHTHVNLDGKEVGDGVTKYVDGNMAENAELEERGSF